MPFAPLSEDTEFAFPPGIFDVRGWEVRTMADGEKVGEVEDLLLDDSGSIRYLDVDLNAPRKHVLIPVSRTRVDEAEGVVWVPALSRSQFEAVPSYNHDPRTLTDEYQNRLAAAYEVRGPARTATRPSEPSRVRPEWRTAHIREEGPGGTMAAVPPRTGPLVSLSTAGEYEVTGDNPDPRGWDLVMSDQRRVGTVHDLIVEPTALKVRYLDCELTMPEHGHPSGGRHVLIPVGYTRLDEAEEIVYVDLISSAAIPDLPSFAGIPLAPETEQRIFEVFTHDSYGEDRYQG
jgi:sporulation protein YlmC with PRC-barrel domain